MFRSRWIDKLLDPRRSQGRRCRQAAQRRRPVRLMLESLEERVTPDGTMVIPGNATINFYGTSPSPAFTFPVGVNSPAGTVTGNVTASLEAGSSLIPLTPAGGVTL